MAKDETPKKERDSKKVAAGMVGGDKKAANKKNPLEPSEKSAKRKKDTPLSYSSDATDEHDGSQTRRKRNMLEKPTEQAISPLPNFDLSDISSRRQTMLDTPSPSRTLVPKLNVQNGSNNNAYFTHLITGHDHPLPVTIQMEGGQVCRFNHALNPRKGEDSFWEMLANLAAEMRGAVRMEAFGATVDSARESLHLEVAGHVYLQLLSTTGQLRYTKANPSELVVAKKHYKKYLISIAECAKELLTKAKETLAERKDPITTSEFTGSLISTIPGKPQTITEHAHRSQMNAHETALALASEISRQELVSVGTIASNYADGARKASITLATIYAYVKQLLDPAIDSDTDPSSPVLIKEETTATAELQDISSSSASEHTVGSTSEPIINRASKPVASKATRRPGFPDFVVKELLRGHKCSCAD